MEDTAKYAIAVKQIFEDSSKDSYCFVRTEDGIMRFSSRDTALVFVKDSFSGCAYDPELGGYKRNTTSYPKTYFFIIRL